MAILDYFTPRPATPDQPKRPGRFFGVLLIVLLLVLGIGVWALL